MMEYWNVDLQGCDLFIYFIAEGSFKISHSSIFPEPITPVFHYSTIPAWAKPLNTI
jgi:hypothetical protein